MDVKIEQSWKDALADEFGKPYFVSLVRFLHEEKAAGKRIFPPGSQIFRAFDLTPLDKVKVVIIGQDARRTGFLFRCLTECRLHRR